MATAAIHAWLQSKRDFSEGVALLNAYGAPDEATAFLLGLGETSVSMSLLIEELQGLHDAAVARTQQRPTVHIEVVTKAEIVQERNAMARDPRADGYDQVTLPNELRAVRDQAKDDLREMNYLRARLETMPSDQDRFRDAKRIVQLDLNIASAYVRLDTYRDTGRDTGGTEEVPTHSKSGVELSKELRNIISYLARHNSGVRKQSPEKVAHWNSRKAELITLIDAL
jgi:hypothetical protein